MRISYSKKNIIIVNRYHIYFFFIKNLLKKIIILLFLTSTSLAQTNQSITCDQTKGINYFKNSLISYANESNTVNLIELKKYLEKQIVEKNKSKNTSNIQNEIYSSLNFIKNYKDLSKAYSNNIDKYDYYEFFTSQIFCSQIKNLKYVDTSFALSAANSILERKLVKKIINSHKKIVFNSKINENKIIEKSKKNIKTNPAIPMMILLTTKPPEVNIKPKWDSGVSTLTYNTTTYDTVRASEDWTDLNNNFDGEYSDNDFRNENNPVHPYETIGADDAYAYGFTGKGQMIALLDGNFCPAAHEEIKRMYDEGRIIVYPRDYSGWPWCDSSSYHGPSVAGFAAGDFQNDSTNYEDTIMGVAYNASLHLAENYGSSKAHWNPTKWAAATDDAKASGAIVQNNSWGFDDDLNPDKVKNYMNDNNATLNEALVYYQGTKTEGLEDDDKYDIGQTTTQDDWTTDEWQVYFDSMNSFQEQGVIVNAGSNDHYGNLGIVNCVADIDGNKQCRSDTTITIDTHGGLPYLLPSLRDAWIQVVNVLNYGTDNGKKQMWSGPCGQMGEWCVSGDAVLLPGIGHTDSGGNDDNYFLEGYGTSYAAPMVSGAVAIMAEAFPNLKPSEWTQRIFATANNSWFNNTNCFDWSKVTDSSLVSKGDVGKSQDDSYFTASCGGIDGYAEYGDGVTHGYNQIYGHGYPDLKKALEPISYKRIRVRDTQYALAASTILLSGLTYQNFNFDGAQGQFHDALYTGFNFKMDDLVKQPIRSHSRYLNPIQDSSFRRQYINSIGNDKNTTNLNYIVNYTEEENLNEVTDNISPEISTLSFNISNKNNTTTNIGYNISSLSLLNFDVGERPLKNFLSNGDQQNYLPFTVAMDNGYSFGQSYLLNNQNKLSYTFYQGNHNYTNKIETGFLLNFSTFNFKNTSFLNAYTGYNIEEATFLRNQTAGAFGDINSQTYHTGFSYENHLFNDLYFGSNINLAYTATTISKDTLISSVDPLFTTQYVIGFVEKNIINKNDFISFNISQPLSLENGKANIKVPYYFNKNNNGFNEQQIDMSVKDRFNKLNLDYIYNFNDNNQLHAGITIGMINFSELDSSSFIVNYKLFF